MFTIVQGELVPNARKSVSGTTHVRRVQLDVLTLRVAILVDVMLTTLVGTVKSLCIRRVLHLGGALQSVDHATAPRTVVSIQVVTKQPDNATVG